MFKSNLFAAHPFSMFFIRIYRPITGFQQQTFQTNLNLSDCVNKYVTSIYNVYSAFERKIINHKQHLKEKRYIFESYFMNSVMSLLILHYESISSTKNAKKKISCQTNVSLNQQLYHFDHTNFSTIK